MDCKSMICYGPTNIPYTQPKWKLRHVPRIGSLQAYDLVSWEFLAKILGNFGLPKGMNNTGHGMYQFNIFLSTHQLSTLTTFPSI